MVYSIFFFFVNVKYYLVGGGFHFLLVTLIRLLVNQQIKRHPKCRCDGRALQAQISFKTLHLRLCLWLRLAYSFREEKVPECIQQFRNRMQSGELWVTDEEWHEYFPSLAFTMYRLMNTFNEKLKN